MGTKKRATAKRESHKKSFKKHLAITLSAFGIALVIMYVSFQVSPGPGALVIRSVFNKGGHKTLQAMKAVLPDYPVAVLSNQQYRAHDKDALLDVYMPNSALKPGATLPAVIWTHGGGWLSGNKTDDAPYFKWLADQGFVVIAPNYSLAPGKKYPTQIHQLNDAHAYIEANAAQYHVDTHKIILAGDSAGAQLSSQMAALITNPGYAHEVGVQPALQPSQLRGVVLFCGIYKMKDLAEPAPSLPKIIDWGDNTTVWAYSGTRDDASPVIRQMSTYYHVTKAFPATFISGGNADPLTDSQSVPFAQELQSLGVNVTSLFYPADHEPKLPHEYQFTIDRDGREAFTQMTQFLKSATGR
ncbi:MAG TPA: alpha/beta hydrolase [Candidatus Saccharimonadales bacterium]